MHESTTVRNRSTFATALKICLVVAALVGVVLLIRLVPVDRLLQWLTQQVNALGAWGPVAFGALFVVLTLTLVPATPVALAAGAVFGSLWGVVTISAASTVSAALAFLMIRYFAYERVAGNVRQYRKLDAVYRALGGPDGWKLVAAVRLSHALPFGVQNLLFGVSPIRFVPYILATWAAMLPGTIVYTYLGHVSAAALGSEAEGGPGPGAGGWLLRVVGLLLAALCLIYIIGLARRVIREKAHVDLAEDPLRLPPEKTEAVTGPAG